MELERECLEVYRRKVDEAANTKACFHQTVAAREAELATLVVALGERDVHSPDKRLIVSLSFFLFCNSFDAFVMVRLKVSDYVMNYATTYEF